MDYEKLKELVDKGLSQRQIAEELDISRKVVVDWLRQHDLHTNPYRDLVSEEEANRLANLVAEGYSTHRIASEIGKSQSYVVRQLRRYGLKTDPYQKEKLFCRKCGVELSARKKVYCSGECKADYEFEQRLINGEPSPKMSIHAIKRWLLRQRGHQCEVCKLTEWLDQPIPLELHHIDGDAKNNTFANLQLICPNCHALTETYKAKNTGNGRAYRRERYKNKQSY